MRSALVSLAQGTKDTLALFSTYWLNVGNLKEKVLKASRLTQDTCLFYMY